MKAAGPQAKKAPTREIAPQVQLSGTGKEVQDAGQPKGSGTSKPATGKETGQRGTAMSGPQLEQSPQATKGYNKYLELQGCKDVTFQAGLKLAKKIRRHREEWSTEEMNETVQTLAEKRARLARTLEISQNLSQVAYGAFLSRI